MQSRCMPDRALASIASVSAARDKGRRFLALTLAAALELPAAATLAKTHPPPSPLLRLVETLRLFANGTHTQ